MKKNKNFPKIDIAFILAGGRGKRMLGFSTLPQEIINQKFNPLKMHKSMIPIQGRPLLEHIILWLKKEGIKRIIIGVGHLKESIINYFKDGKKWGVKIIYTEHNPDGGTADALKEDLEKSKIKDRYFFAMNADQLTSLPLKRLVEIHFSGKIKPIATICLVYPPFPYGKVIWDSRSKKIINFEEKPIVQIPTNSGIYLFSREIKPYLKGDLERETFPVLAKKGKIKGYLYKGFWETINTVKDWERVNEKLKTL